MIEGQCPVCRRVFKVDDRYAGMTGHCKACGAAIRVPGEPDEGLDGLPEPPGAAAEQVPPPPTAVAAHVASPQPAPALSPSPAPEAPPPARQEHPADELARAHDARDRYEPSEGPTTLKGSWLKEPEAAAAPAAPAEPAAPAPQPARALLSERFITPPPPEPSAAQHRPKLVSVACAALLLLGVGFALHFGTAGRWGLAAAGLGLALAGLAIVRLWTARWDGLLAGLLLCLCVAGSARVDPQAVRANYIFLAAAAVVLLLLLLTLARRSGRDYFTS
ncbi:MAG: hypothetical protein FJ290_13120 [Planctomycetes bacterium]|nr:hypothetical protein [Planctomycetota bacterium]